LNDFGLSSDGKYKDEIKVIDSPNIIINKNRSISLFKKKKTNWVDECDNHTKQIFMSHFGNMIQEIEDKKKEYEE